MRVLLVTLTDMLPFVLTQVLNSNPEYCAIVVDDIEKARNITRESKPLQNLLQPFYELKECVENYHYDVVLGVSNPLIVWKLREKCIECGVPRKKFFSLIVTFNALSDFWMKNVLKFYKDHAAEFEIFATGISYTAIGLDANQFKYKLFNFGRSSQDLYYDYQIAKFALSDKGGGSGYVKYVLIGLAQYSFHYDLSKAYGNGGRILQYYITFNDVHNFWLPKEKFPRLFKEQYLSTTLQADSMNLNNIYGEKVGLQFMDWEKQFDVRKGIDEWKSKSYPETVEENVKILDAYLKLCEENNVRPIIFLPPLTKGYLKHFNRKMIDEFYCLVHEAQKKYPATVFVNGWNLNNFSDRDFYDSSHLNSQGAAKFSAILNRIIDQIENSKSR